MSKPEYDYIHSDTDHLQHGMAAANAGDKLSWLQLLSVRHTWAFAIGKFLTDPISWFYLFWLPAFLKAQYNLTGTAVVLPVALVLHNIFYRKYRWRVVAIIINKKRLVCDAFP